MRLTAALLTIVAVVTGTQIAQNASRDPFNFPAAGLAYCGTPSLPLRPVDSESATVTFLQVTPIHSFDSTTNAIRSLSIEQSPPESAPALTPTFPVVNVTQNTNKATSASGRSTVTVTVSTQIPYAEPFTPEVATTEVPSISLADKIRSENWVDSIQTKSTVTVTVSTPLFSSISPSPEIASTSNDVVAFAIEKSTLSIAESTNVRNTVTITKATPVPNVVPVTQISYGSSQAGSGFSLTTLASKTSSSWEIDKWPNAKPSMTHPAQQSAGDSEGIDEWPNTTVNATFSYHSPPLPSMTLARLTNPRPLYPFGPFSSFFNGTMHETTSGTSVISTGFTTEYGYSTITLTSIISVIPLPLYLSVSSFGSTPAGDTIASSNIAGTLTTPTLSAQAIAASSSDMPLVTAISTSAEEVSNAPTTALFNADTSSPVSPALTISAPPISPKTTITISATSFITIVEVSSTTYSTTPTISTFTSTSTSTFVAHLIGSLPDLSMRKSGTSSSVITQSATSSIGSSLQTTQVHLTLDVFGKAQPHLIAAPTDEAVSSQVAGQEVASESTSGVSVNTRRTGTKAIGSQNSNTRPSVPLTGDAVSVRTKFNGWRLVVFVVITGFVMIL